MRFRVKRGGPAAWFTFDRTAKPVQRPEPEKPVSLAQALDKVMELAVEMPTYQRKDMSCYNKNVLDESTMTPVSERSPYNGLLSRIWELNYR